MHQQAGAAPLASVLRARAPDLQRPELLGSIRAAARGDDGPALSLRQTGARRPRAMTAGSHQETESWRTNSRPSPRLAPVTIAVGMAPIFTTRTTSAVLGQASPQHTAAPSHEHWSPALRTGLLWNKRARAHRFGMFSHLRRYAAMRARFAQLAERCEIDVRHAFEICCVCSRCGGDAVVPSHIPPHDASPSLLCAALMGLRAVLRQQRMLERGRRPRFCLPPAALAIALAPAAPSCSLVSGG